MKYKKIQENTSGIFQETRGFHFMDAGDRELIYVGPSLQVYHCEYRELVRGDCCVFSNLLMHSFYNSSLGSFKHDAAGGMASPRYISR